MKENILILTTIIIILCRIRYSLKKIKCIENNMDNLSDSEGCRAKRDIRILVYIYNINIIRNSSNR